jgi:hypothetical protein
VTARDGILGVFTPRDRNDDHVDKFGRSWLAPGDDEWLRIITPSKIATILTRDGRTLSRWESPFRLWHRMKNLVGAEPPKAAFDIGHDLEPYAANRWRHLNPGWLLSPGEVQFHIDPDKYGFPAVCTLDRRAVRGRSRRVVEMKAARNLTDLEVWGDDLKGECPEDVAAQVVSQQMFTGWTSPADVLVIGPYYQERIYPIHYDTSVASWIIAECGKFWASLAGDEPPDLDSTTATYECLRQLHPEIDGSSVVLDPDEAIDFLSVVEDHKEQSDALQYQKSLMLKRLERAQYAVVGDKRICERRNNGKGGVSFYVAKGVTTDDIRFMAGAS